MVFRLICPRHHLCECPPPSDDALTLPRCIPTLGLLLFLSKGARGQNVYRALRRGHSWTLRLEMEILVCKKRSKVVTFTGRCLLGSSPCYFRVPLSETVSSGPTLPWTREEGGGLLPVRVEGPCSGLLGAKCGPGEKVAQVCLRSLLRMHDLAGRPSEHTALWDQINKERQTA